MHKDNKIDMRNGYGEDSMNTQEKWYMYKQVSTEKQCIEIPHMYTRKFILNSSWETNWMWSQGCLERPQVNVV